MLIDDKLPKEQAKSLFSMVERFEGIRQVYLVNNNIEAEEMNQLFETISGEMIESIILAGKNEIDVCGV